jgi:predicted restriction endonuclease
VKYRNQIPGCGKVIDLKDGAPYAEAHHVKPLGAPHDGPDVRENILCVCPNHHAQLDYGAIMPDGKSLKTIDAKYIEYHNKKIFGEENYL